MSSFIKGELQPRCAPLHGNFLKSRVILRYYWSGTVFIVIVCLDASPTL
jgi:hypothetical protein